MDHDRIGRSELAGHVAQGALHRRAPLRGGKIAEWFVPKLWQHFRAPSCIVAQTRFAGIKKRGNRVSPHPGPGWGAAGEPRFPAPIQT